MRGVKEPEIGVDADAETAMMCRIGLEAIDDGDVGKRARFARGSENLRRVRRDLLDESVRTYLPEARHAHDCCND